MWTSWMPAFPLHKFCKETKEKLSHSKLVSGAIASKPLMSAKGEGAGVQLQAELDPRKGFCFCFRDPVAVFLFCSQYRHPAQNLYSIYSDEVVKK